MNCWLIFGTMLSASLLAQQATNTPATVSSSSAVSTTVVTNAAASTNAPAKASKKKSTAKSPKKKATKPKPLSAATELKTVPLIPGPATVVASNVNVRAQAKLNSEVVARASKGQQLTVIEEIVRNNSGANEPSAWAKIALPPSAKAFVNSAYLSNNAVGPKRLKVRAGPGENYSVLGILKPGEAVKTVSVKGDWTQIEPPADAFAFIAAQYLSQEKAPATIAAAPTASTTSEVPAPTTNTVPESPTVAPTTTTEAPATPTPPAAEKPATTNLTAQAPATTNATEAATSEEPPPKRIVQHEGFVRGMTSIQAPSHFALVSPESGRTINYLYSPSRDFDLRRYKGLHVVVTGEESLDERWGNTPVITIQKIELVSE